MICVTEVGELNKVTERGLATDEDGVHFHGKLRWGRVNKGRRRFITQHIPR